MLQEQQHHFGRSRETSNFMCTVWRHRLGVCGTRFGFTKSRACSAKKLNDWERSSWLKSFWQGHFFPFGKFNALSTLLTASLTLPTSRQEDNTSEIRVTRKNPNQMTNKLNEWNTSVQWSNGFTVFLARRWGISDPLATKCRTQSSGSTPFFHITSQGLHDPS